MRVRLRGRSVSEFRAQPRLQAVGAPTAVPRAYFKHPAHVRLRSQRKQRIAEGITLLTALIYWGPWSLGFMI
jgi:hypothetical protein